MSFFIFMYYISIGQYCLRQSSGRYKNEKTRKDDNDISDSAYSCDGKL